MINENTVSNDNFENPSLIVVDQEINEKSEININENSKPVLNQETNVSIEKDSLNTNSEQQSSFFGTNYNESLTQFFFKNSKNQKNKTNQNSIINNLKTLSGTILNSLKNTFQPSSSQNDLTNNLNYCSNNNSDQNKASINEPLLNSQSNDNPTNNLNRYPLINKESPSFSSSSSDNFSFNTILTATTNANSILDSKKNLNDKGLKKDEESIQIDTTKKKTKKSITSFFSNNIYKLNLDNLQANEDNNNLSMFGNTSLNKQLTIYEKRYLLAVERGDLAGVRRMIEMAPQIEQQEKEKEDLNGQVFNINCTDPIGRSALLMAIDNENLDMIELLVECGVEMRDSLLHAINEEFVEAVELLLDYEEALQRNKKTALELSLSNESDVNKKTQEKLFNYNYESRPTLIQNKSELQNEKENNNFTASNNFFFKADAKQIDQIDQINSKDSINDLKNLVNKQKVLNEFSKKNIILQANKVINNSPQVTLLYSWEGFERETFTSDVTPLILAAHKNNYEIIKLLLDRGISPIPCPHDARCGCKECTTALQSDCLRYSRSRINAYRALASPSLIALSSRDPIHTAFELSWQLRRLSFLEPEFKTEYVELRKQCQAFATALLDHTRTHFELEVLLNYEPEVPVTTPNTSESISCGSGRMRLSRLKLAIRYKQKKFCAHANVQQLLASIWYEGLPGFRRRNIVLQILQILLIGFLFPVLALAYIVAPCSKFGQIIKKPFIKFICHSASYMTFLTLASQRIETNAFDIFGVNSSSKTITKRGAPPTLIELMVLAWVIGLIWSEIKQLWELGLFDYMSDMWNILDFITNSLYVATITLRIIAYLQVQKEISMHTGTASLPREDWDAFDPILLAEGLYAAANIFSSLKLVYIFSVNPHLGPLQISLGRMVVDILKFFSVYILVLFAFACGMNQLLWYYADMEKQVCIGNTTIITNLTNLRPTAGTFINNQSNNNNRRFKFKSLKSANEACLTWRRFANLFESFQTLFWASFGLIDLENFELTGIQSYTRFWGLLMFGCYCVINVVVLINLLIAMMNHSYQSISEQADTEWKFARTKLWMSYFEDGATVPPPFNVIPTPKSVLYFFKWFIRKFCSQTKFAKNEALKTIRRKAKQASQRDHRYLNVIRVLVRRYITNEQRIAERKRGVTEDDCNEIKQDISALRFELIELMNKKSNSHLGLNTCTNCFQNCNEVCDCFDPMYCNCNKSFCNKKCICSMEFDENCNQNSFNNLNQNTNTNKNNLPLSGSYGNLNQSLSNQVSSTGKRDRQKERRLMKGFDFNCLYLDSNASLDNECNLLMQNFNSNNLILNNNSKKPQHRNKFIRLARGIASKRTRSNSNFLDNLNNSLINNNRTLVNNSNNNKWKQLIEATRNKVKPFSRSSESVNTDANSQNSKTIKKETSNYQLDATVKRSLFARKITSLLKDDHFSLDTEKYTCNWKKMSSSLSKTLSSVSSEINSSYKSDMDQIAEISQNKMKNEWI